MEITDVKVIPVDDDKLKAFVSIVFDKCFVVTDIKVILGPKGLFVSMPSKKRKDGSFKDIAHLETVRVSLVVEDVTSGDRGLVKVPDQGLLFHREVGKAIRIQLHHSRIIYSFQKVFAIRRSVSRGCGRWRRGGRAARSRGQNCHQRQQSFDHMSNSTRSRCFAMCVGHFSSA